VSRRDGSSPPARQRMYVRLRLSRRGPSCSDPRSAGPLWLVVRTARHPRLRPPLRRGGRQRDDLRRRVTKLGSEQAASVLSPEFLDLESFSASSARSAVIVVTNARIFPCCRMRLVIDTNPSATLEGQPERRHLLAVANQQDVADEHRVVPGLGIERRKPRELRELVGGRAYQRQLTLL
jgi:hypothetical protein